MKNLAILLMFSIAPAIAQQSELSAGKDSYRSGDFKTAAAHFEIALHADPRSAESSYWLGRSYETLADIATPFGRRYRSLASDYLSKAAELAPARPEYRHELFEFLLDSGRERQALGILLSSAESDPEYEYMLARFRQTQRLNASLLGRLARLSQLATAWH